MPSSYRQNGDLRPLRYRTPSPPIDAFEPNSPTSDLLSAIETPAQWPDTNTSRNTSEQPAYSQSNRNVARHSQSLSSQDSMNAFASIVLSTTSTWPHQNKSQRQTTPPNQYSRHIEQSDERPAKRARSEKLPSPARIRTQANPASRPATSYAESITDSMTKEAELLLNFSQSARFAITSTTAQVHPWTPGREFPGAKLGKDENTSPNTRAMDCSTYPLGNGAGHQTAPGVDVLHHSPGLNGDLLLHPSKQSEKDVRMASPPEIPTHDFRNQLIEASDFGQRPISPSTTQIARSTATVHRLPHGHTSACLVDENRGSHVSPGKQDQDIVHDGHGGSPEDGMVDHELFPVHDKQEKQDSMVGPRGIQETRIWAHSYWPSTLATTVEPSICASKIRPREAIRKLESHIRQPDNELGVPPSLQTGAAKADRAPEPAICAACNFTRNSMSVETDSESTSWISCDGCKSWFHFACAGFKNEREVRAVDKFRCRGCKKVHGPTTYVRKSGRAHAAIDYAGLNQGVIKTSDERPEHHYIKPIKDGTINIQPESFARMRPELVTAEHFEKGNGMKEPIVIPAEFNPRPGPAGASEISGHVPSDNHSHATLPEDYFARDPECRHVPDHGQDALDMVIPHDLTVRKVAELYGPEEKIEVIDVKSQNGEGKKWNMRRWAEYYENASKKVVRNVISLEVSQSILGRLIRRPQIVRDLDLQDSVWPADLQAKGEFPHVQFYCLMSVADCFTDFHIDFGGSSVFYHILKGKKTFFFIPPKEKHLKKYEEWCMSPAQNWTFLGDQTKECYRVDLSEGDTMLIPAGWIHAVWTPEDSLVIGGNFLTRLNYSMQLRIAQVEKTTGVARKFRYPHFQKIQWYTAIRYLESDPLPASVRSDLEAGGSFHRQSPAYHDFDTWGENSQSGAERYHARYYSQPELEGLPDLVRYLLRTALIDSGEITEGLTVDARNAVKKSIPRGYGEPLELVKSFAIWCAWKRGNESIPHWAHANPVRENYVAESTAKLNGAALKKLECEAALQAPRRHSARNQVQQPPLSAKIPDAALDIHPPNHVIQPENPTSSLPLDPKALHGEPLTPYQISSKDGENHRRSEAPSVGEKKRRKSAPGPGAGSQRKTACETCRRRRRACKHDTDPKPQTPPAPQFTPTIAESHEPDVHTSPVTVKVSSQAHTGQFVQYQFHADTVPVPYQKDLPELSSTISTDPPQLTNEEHAEEVAKDITVYEPLGDAGHDIGPKEVGYQRATPKGRKTADRKSLTTPQGRGRSKACNECRKSKRRCLHDEHGQEDPIKIRDAAHPRSAPASKRRKLDDQSLGAPVQPKSDDNVPPEHVFHFMNSVPPTIPVVPTEAHENAPMAVTVAGVGSKHAESDGQLPSNAIHEPQTSFQRNNAVETIPDQESSGFAGTRTEDFTPLAVQQQDANEIQANAESSSESPRPETMQQTSITPVEPLKHEMPIQLESSGSFGQPGASCLVSPPASSHEDSEQPNQTENPKPIYSGSSSRHSSRHGQTQRFTPESGPARRESSSSSSAAMVDTLAAGDKSSNTASLSPILSEEQQAVDSAQQKRMKARAHSDTVPDEESFKLIRALQAQDYGLRRRKKESC
ncbi:MAG: hypothetical protein Q9172_001363 [Xanthocarpia lactea]